MGDDGRQYYRDQMTTDALEGVGGEWAAWMVACGVAAGCAVTAGLIIWVLARSAFGGDLAVALGVALIVPLLGIGAYTLFRMRRTLAGRGRALLATVGWGFDRDAYCAALGENRMDGSVNLTVTFVQPPLHQDELAAQIRDWMELTCQRVYFADDTLHVISRERTGRTEWHSDSSGGADWTNRPFHSELVRLIVRVVRPLAAAHPIQTLAVEIEGPTFPWDTPATRV